MRTIVLAAVLAASLLSTVTASALERNSADMRKNQGIIVAVADAAPSHDEALPTAAPAPAPATDAPAAGATEKKPSLTGVVFELHTGVGILGGKLVDGIDAGGTFVELDAKVGGYVTPHLGLFGGVKGGFGSFSEGCASDCSSAHHYAFPVSVQYAFADRTRGAYLESGFTLLPTYQATNEGSKNRGIGFESIDVRGLLDASFGGGYRIPVDLLGGTSTGSAIDIHAGLDVGKFDAFEYRTQVGSLKGDIADDKRALHYTASLTIGWHFAP